MKQIRVGLLLLGSLLASGRVEAAVFTVNSTGEEVDAVPGDAACLTAVATCTLRAAIQEANALAGADSIHFNIGGGGVQTITLTSALPFISQAVTIDGTTQPLYPGTPIIELSAALCGGFGALDLRGGSSGSTIRGLVINGCPSRAIRLLGTSNNVVAGNFLGTNVAGTAALANNTGVYIGGSATATNNNRVGGTVAADRNVISGNTADGVQINGGAGGAANNRIEGNYIGLDVSGTLDLGNGGQGVGIFGANTNTNNVVGGTALNAGNVISGNGNDGVLIANAGTTGTLVQGNRIGTNAAGTAAIPNLRGVEFDAATSGNTIGGTAAGAPNRIAYNVNGGVEFTPSAGAGNAILSNEIYSNGTLGIDLGENAVTPNDPGDADSGPNALLNFPDITAATVSGGSVSVSFQLDVPAGSYRIEFFTNPSGTDTSDHGEGQVFAGERNVAHPGGGAVAFTHVIAGASGDRITATATFCTDGATCAAFGSTSEFSAFELVACCSLSTAETATTVTVSAPGQFELRFNTAVGGGIDQFYDLAEDPTRTYDLAGGSLAATALLGQGVEVGGVFYTTYDGTGKARVHLLEATSARVKVRHTNVYGNGVTSLPGASAVGDYAILPSGRLALDLTRRLDAAVTYIQDHLDMGQRYDNSGPPLNAWAGYEDPGVAALPSHTRAFPPHNTFWLAQIEQAGVRTDFLRILHRDWTAANGYFNDADQARLSQSSANGLLNTFWREATGGTISAGTRESWRQLVYFKPTNLASHADAAVTSRRDDYRTPSAISVGPGAQWQDAVENTLGAGDFFNEAESAYVFDLDPASGLTFGMDGSATTRYAPFFKIRRWRSFVEAPTVTFDADGGGPGLPSALVKNVDYKAAVKPLSRAHITDNLKWHCTLDDTSVTNTCTTSGTDLDVGASGGASGVAMVPARYGFGAEFDANADYVTAPAGSLANFDPGSGAIEFWYQPNTNHDTATSNVLWRANSANDCFLFEKTGTSLRFRITKESGSNCTVGGTTYQVTVTSANYFWRAKDWVHLRTTWTNASLGRMSIWLNGVELGFTTGYSSVSVDNPPALYFGGCTGLSCPFSTTGNAEGILDELTMYAGVSEPTSIAHAGRVGAGDEYLADSGLNLPLNLVRVDGSGRGRYLYFGADSKFLGLNVSLVTVGQGLADADVAWEYWNGSSGFWAALAPTDGTRSFQQTGTVSWADPAGWRPMSVSGGPDLFYVRAHLPATASADYSQIPVERQIRTDILLFQYCGDVTTSATFAFSVPPTTAVKLQSFTAKPGDASVLLEWRTASELDNLGFHLFRALSADGPWTRLTASLIPGLGSSAVGQGYSFRDLGLANGTRYFYRLEDVDASSKATSHGPVSAAPMAGGASDGGAAGAPAPIAGKRNGPPPASCPDWVVSAYASLAGASSAAGPLSCTRHGDPEAVSFAVVSRDARQATLELRTGGFYALHTPSGAGEASGGVRVFVPGFDSPQEASAAALPFRRALVDAVVGRRVQIGGVRALDVASYEGLAPAALGAVEMRISADGTVRAVRREGRQREARGGGARRGDFTASGLARLLPAVFQGETKSAVVEIAPLRYDAGRRQLVLAKRVRVKLLFRGREPGETGRGSLGRRQRPGPSVAGELLARLHTTSRGLHAVSFEQLFPGRSRGHAADELRLEREGRAVGFHLEPAGALFGPGGRLYFHAEITAASTDYSSETAFELRRARDGARLTVASAAPAGAPASSVPWTTESFEVNRFYQPGLLEAPDPWLWEGVPSGATRVKSFALAGLAAGEAAPGSCAELDVYLQGASESGNPVDHHVSVALNGVPLGEAQFAGKRPYRMSLCAAPSLLREAANELSLTNVADTGVSSYVFLDRFALTYPRGSSLASGRLEGVWPVSGPVSLSGASGRPVVVDVTDAGAARWLTGLESAGGTLRFRAEAGRRYLAVAPQSLIVPRVTTPAPSSLRAATNRADWLLIAPRAFLGAAEPLVARRQDQGLEARAVAFEEIADEFGRGQPSAEAMRVFLAYAYQSWARPSPRYVLLLGDASYDPRNFMGSSKPAPLPALWTRTSYLWTASDPLLAAVNGEDALPDLAIGRLPAATVEQAQALVEKLAAWEDSGQGLEGRAALVADNPDLAGDFEANVEDIRASFLGSRETRLLKLRELGPATRSAIQDALDTGLGHLGYVGHGGAAVWASENVWSSWDAASLQAQSRQPLLLTLNCLNGYFVAPAFDSLAESLVKAEGRGAIAAVSPSGLSLDGPAHQYHRALMAELTSGRHERLGDALLAAQHAYAQGGLMPELLSIYHLLGDPGTRIR